MLRGLARLCAVVIDAGVAAVDAVGGVLADGLRRLGHEHPALAADPVEASAVPSQTDGTPASADGAAAAAIKKPGSKAAGDLGQGAATEA